MEASDELAGKRVDRWFADQLVARAKADGLGLGEPGGLLAGLSNRVLEAGLEMTPSSRRIGRDEGKATLNLLAITPTMLTRRPSSPTSNDDSRS